MKEELHLLLFVIKCKCFDDEEITTRASEASQHTTQDSLCLFLVCKSCNQRPSLFNARAIWRQWHSAPRVSSERRRSQWVTKIDSHLLRFHRRLDLNFPYPSTATLRFFLCPDLCRDDPHISLVSLWMITILVALKKILNRTLLISQFKNPMLLTHPYVCCVMLVV